MNCKFYKILPFILIIFLIQGCLLTKKKYPEKNLFIIEAKRDSSINKLKKIQSVLKIAKFRISPIFQGKGFVYRTDDLVYESDFYNEFLISPDEMFTEAVMKWFIESKMFKHVMVSPGHVESNYILESSIISLYGDFIDKHNPKAVLEINFTVIKDKKARYKIIFKKQYRKDEPVAKGAINGLVKAWSMALKKILMDFEKDIQEKI